MTLALRRLLTKLTCIRRVPDWTTGDFITPFAERGKPAEVHRYWADGSFVFGRDQQSKGFVVDTREYQPGQISHSIQYINFDTKGLWDSWAEFCYRPGVTLLRSDGRTDHDEGSRSGGVLVLQACDGMYSPSEIPPDAYKLAPAQGKCVSLKRDGTNVKTNLSFGPDGVESPIGDPISNGRLIFSNMLVHPLPLGEQMPPPEVVRTNTRYLVENQWPTLDQRGTENEVHKAFGGNRADRVAWHS